MRILLLVVLPVLVGPLAGCLSNATVQSVEASEEITMPDTFDHSAFSALLADVVDERGYVDYATLAADPSRMETYLSRLATTDPAGLTEADQLAFWLNTYNAYTLKLIVDNYPVESIRDVVGGVFVPLVNTPFKVEFVNVGGEVMTLDAVEHGTIRKEFDEPRIHFALVCAALSCPPLRAEAYVGDRLDAQLDAQARRFLNDPAKNRIPASEEEVELSKIFSWFKGDFGGNDTALQAFLAPYFEGEVRDRLAAGAYEVDFLGYDWSLNDSATPSASNDSTP